MRQTVLMALGLTFVALSAQAQINHPGAFQPYKAPPTSSSAGAFAPLPSAEPYHSHPPAPAPHQIEATDGGDTFKPFKGTSVYAAPKPFESYPQPPKPRAHTY